MTRDESLTVRGVNETRRGYNKLQGITQVDTAMSYYLEPPYLKSWLGTNAKFFTEPVHPSLVPRGLLFDGTPGTGKTLASKHIASTLGVPLYRLDLGAMMGKYVGQCHAEGTEFLTNNGLKRPQDVTADDKLATLNMETGALEFQAFSVRHEYHFSGMMVQIDTRTTKGLVTPNHQMIMRRPGRAYEFLPAEFIGTKSTEWQVPTSTAGQQGHPWYRKAFYLPSRSVNGNPNKRCGGVNTELDVFLEFLGYFLSEGHTQKNKPGYISLSQNPGAVASRMIEVCRRINERVWVVENRGNLQITFSNLALWHWLNDNCGTNSSTMKIPRQFMSLPQQNLWALLAALIEGDGSIDRKGREGNFLYITTSLELASNIEEIAIRIGMTARIGKHVYSNSVHLPRYVVYASPRKHAVIRGDKHLSRVPYEGQVFCFTVSNSTLLTRYKGTWLISGNSLV